MEKAIKEQSAPVSNIFTKQNLKGAMFNVEVIADKDKNVSFIIRDVKGNPIRIAKNADDVATFFNEVTNEIFTLYDGQN